MWIALVLTLAARFEPASAAELSAGVAGRAGGADAADACVVQHATDVRYGSFGYDHFVHIASACDEVLACEIYASSVAGKTVVTVPERSRISVLVKKGSPSRTFSASVYCKVAE